MALLSFVMQSGRNYPTFDAPFFIAADLKWHFSHKNKTYGPFGDKPSAVRAFQALLQHEGVR